MGDTGLDCHAPLCFEGVIVLVIVCCILGLFWSIYNVYLVCTIKLQETA